ncbi:MAG: autotransporter outer membrane beta-barrel domain-containing protein [Burkholderiales bacterium]|nr:autotransporter outer membrane beta-barrel domain-containing protein [Burkholderiales bacterium]
MLQRKKLYLYLSALFAVGTTHAAYAACPPSGGGAVSLTQQLSCNVATTYTDDISIVTTPSGNGYIAVSQNADLTLNNLTITTSGNGADAIRTSGGATKTISVNGKLTILVNGASADGINASLTGGGVGTIIVGNNAEIKITKPGTPSPNLLQLARGNQDELPGGAAVRANLSSAAGTVSTIIIGDNAIIENGAYGKLLATLPKTNMGATYGVGVYSGERDLETENSNPLGGALVKIGQNSKITTTGDFGFAVHANKTGQIELGSTTIATSGASAHGIVAQDGTVSKCPPTNNALCLALGTVPQGTVPSAYLGGEVYLTGDTSIAVSGTGAYALIADGDKSLIASKTLSGQSTSGVYRITGNLLAQNKGVIDLTMNDGSTLTGTTDSAGRAFDAVTMRALGIYSSAFFTAAQDTLAGAIHLAINGATSTWQLTGNSNLDTLNLSGNAKVILDDSQTDVDAVNSRTLTVKTLGGSGGVFVSRVNTVTQDADLLVITQASSGNHTMQFNDSATGSATGAAAGHTQNEKIKVVDFQGAGSNAATFASNGIDYGAYVFELAQENGNWYLKPKTTTSPNNPGGGGATPLPSPDPGPSPTPVPPPTPAPSPTPENPALTQPADHSVNVLNINYLMGYVETQTLLTRLGELRQTENERGDIWGRVYGGHLNHFDDYLADFKARYAGVQVGADRRLTGEDGHTFVGAAASYATLNADYQKGDAKARDIALALYATYYAQSDWYVDGVAQYLMMRNTFETTTQNGYAVHGKGNTRGIRVGIETGKRFYLSDQRDFYLEPQAQVTYARQGGTTIKSSNGLTTRLDRYHSTLGRVSLIAGYAITGETPVNLYVKTGYLREFSGKTGYAFNGVDHTSYEFKGGTWDNGIGINALIAKNHSIYLDAGYGKGKKFNQIGANGGYRYSF